jgi:hypothetical protein
MPVLLCLHRMWRAAAAKAWRLLRVLLLWLRAMSANPGTGPGYPVLPLRPALAGEGRPQSVGPSARGLSVVQSLAHRGRICSAGPYVAPSCSADLRTALIHEGHQSRSGRIAGPACEAISPVTTVVCVWPTAPDAACICVQCGGSAVYSVLRCRAAPPRRRLRGHVRA